MKVSAEELQLNHFFKKSILINKVKVGFNEVTPNYVHFPAFFPVYYAQKTTSLLLFVMQSSIQLNYHMPLNATLYCSLIHNGLPQRGAPNV